PEPNLTPLNHHATHALRAPRSGGKISNNFHCAFSADSAAPGHPTCRSKEAPVRVRPDLLAEPPHRRRDCLSEIESRRLRASAQILDLALETYRHFEGDRFVLLSAF